MHRRLYPNYPYQPLLWIWIPSQWGSFLYNIELMTKCSHLTVRAATVRIFFGFGSVLIFDVSFRLFWFVSSNCILFVFHIQNVTTHNVNLYIFSTTNIKKDNKIATRKSKCSQTSDFNLQEGAIFSRSLNDNRRMIMTGLYFIRFSSQNVCFNK